MTPNMLSAVESFAISEMAAQYPDIPVLPSGVAVPRSASIYVRIWVISSDETVQVAFGNTARSRNVGIVQCDVYGPKDKGAGPTGAVAQYLAKKLTRWTTDVVEDQGYLTLKDASVVDMGDDAEEHRQTVRVGYRYDFSMAAT